ncbi:intracellular protein transport protein USO1-like isoform X2 [Hypomesus transpacificus]|nr:intracellular protein transport protein USO1-like isoform X2 [Hypomesus transpacificus]XP_046894255.1 intracellular protein transport protein USO1-like isoform X2 [Hypomesus transpacificus]
MNQEDKKDKANGGSLSHVLADKAEDLNSEMASSKAVSKPKRKTNMSRLREAVRDWEKKAREATASEREMAKEVEMMKVDRQIVEETIDRLQQKLQIEGQARLHAEQALALAQTNLQDQEIRFQLDRDRLLGLLSGKDEALISLQTQTSLAVAVKAEAETAVGVAMANLQDARRITQELKDRLTSHLQAWEKERQELRSQKNQAVEALKISEQGLTRTTAKLLEVGNRVPSPAQLGVKIQTEISALKAQLFAAHSARTRAEMTCKMTRANLANLEKNLCAEVAKRDDNILILSNEKKEALQVTKKGEQELEAFRSNLMKMAGSMTKLQLDLRDKGNHCSVLEKALEEVQEDLRQTRKELICKCAEIESLQKQACQRSVELEALEAKELKQCQGHMELQQQLRRQAETTCQAQEKSSIKRKKKGGCFGRMLFWRSSQNA